MSEPRRPNTMPIYLDNQASTRVDPRVLEAMLPYFTEQFGNPHSASHAYGRVAEEAIEMARGEIAALIHADPREIVFTSGATEANNLALLGCARANADRGRHLITVRTEHKSVLDPCRRLEREGFSVSWLAPGEGGP